MVRLQFSKNIVFVRLKILFTFTNNLDHDEIQHHAALHLIIWERGGSVVECLTRDLGVMVRVSPASVCCVIEQATLIIA